MSSRRVVIRADASAEIGAGHVMRCVALAQACQDSGADVVFALAEGVRQFSERLRSENLTVAEIKAAPGSSDDALKTIGLCREHGCSWLILDGFQFSSGYRESVRNAATHLLLFDDHGEFAPYRCDLVLNANPYASEAMYPTPEPGLRFLLGPDYALLRREFLDQSLAPPETAKIARNILVTFGGSDPNNVTLLVIQALQDLGDLALRATVIVGASNPHRAVLRAAVEQFPNSRLLFDVGNMAGLMSSSELAISAGGGTCYELAFLHVPMLLVTMAQNHERTVEAWAGRTAAVNAGWFHLLVRQSLAFQLRKIICNPALRRELATNAAALVDGQGAKRTASAMLNQAVFTGCQR